MLGPISIAIVLKSKSSLAILAAALINLATAKRTRQFEIVRELGTLACQIENAKLVGSNYSHLQRQYEALSKLVKG
jgi:hypothetical protein